MNEIEFSKYTPFKMFSTQFVDILIYSVGLIIVYFFINIPFYIISLFLLPIIIYFVFAKYNKSVIKITIDKKNKKIILRLNYFLIYNKDFFLSFNNIAIKVRHKWLFKVYWEVIEFNIKNKSIAVIPYEYSIWDKKELTDLLNILYTLNKENLIKLTLEKGTSFKPSLSEDL